MATDRPATIRARLLLLAGLLSLDALPGRAEVPLPDLAIDRGRLVGRYDLNFRGSHYDYQALRVEGSGVLVSLVKPTKNGLRVHVPPRTNGAGVGLCTKFGIRGDFEVVVSYEIIDAPKPSQGPGIGPEVFLQSMENWDDHIALSRRVAARTGDATLAGEIARGGASKIQVGDGSIKSASKEGRLYIARSGSTIHLYAAEGNGDFKKVCVADFGVGDLRFVRLSTLFDGADRGLDVLWKELSVRAESLPRDPGNSSSGGFPSTLLMAMVGVVLGVVLVVGINRYRRSRVE